MNVLERQCFEWLCIGADGNLPLVGGCGGNKIDGFSNEDWSRVEAIAPMSSPMPGAKFDVMADDHNMAKFGQRLFFDKRGAEAIQVDGPSGKGPYTPTDPATGKPLVDMTTMKPIVIPGETQKVSCQTCHGSPYWTDARPYPVSHGRNWLAHNTPTMVNNGYLDSVLWTGRFDSLREHGAGAMGGNSTTLAQVHFIYTYWRDQYNALFPGTIMDPNSPQNAATGMSPFDPMAPDAARFPATGNPKGAATVNGKPVMSADGVIEKLPIADQWELWKFKGNMGILFEAHPRRLLTPNSAFEKYVRTQDSSLISESAKNGLRLFIGKASCLDCHNGPALSDNQFHNIGVPTPGVFPPGSTTPGVADRGRGGVLTAQLNNQLMNLNTNDNLPDAMTHVPIFGGAGQYSDHPDQGRQRLIDLDAQLCQTHSSSVDDITAACQALFYPGAPADDTKVPPDAAKPADPRLAVCISSNTSVCTKYPDSEEGSFRTPSLINVAMTGPYFHTGLYNTLRDVVQHYNQGGAPAGTFAGTKSPRLRPLGLTDGEVDDLVEFLKTLTGELPDVDWSCDPSLPTVPEGQKSISMGACAASATM